MHKFHVPKDLDVPYLSPHNAGSIHRLYETNKQRDAILANYSSCFGGKRDKRERSCKKESTEILFVNQSALKRRMQKRANQKFACGM